MSKYRIVEETGVKTHNKRFYIEYLYKPIFREPVWRIQYQYHPTADRRMLKFDDLEGAKKWLDDKTELVNNKIHSYE